MNNELAVEKKKRERERETERKGRILFQTLHFEESMEMSLVV